MPRNPYFCSSREIKISME